MATDNATVGYASTKQAGGAPVVITIAEQKKQAAEAKARFKEQDEAYNKAVREEREAFEKAKSTYATADASLAALKGTIQTANEELKRQSDDHKIAGYALAAAGVVALVLTGPVAIGVTIVIAGAGIANSFTKPQNEPIGKRIKTPEGVKDVVSSAKSAGDVAVEFLKHAGKKIPEAVPGVSAVVDVGDAIYEGAQGAPEIQGENAATVEALDKLDERIDDVQQSDVFGSDLNKETMKAQLQATKRAVVAYDDALAKYQAASVKVALLRATFIEAAIAAHVPVG